MTGVALGNPKCSTCCVPVHCDDCPEYGRCWPRFLCVVARVTPGPYFENDGCCVESPGVCCERIAFRLSYGTLDPDDFDEGSPPPQECYWSGSGICTEYIGASLAIAVSVRIVKVEGVCYTQIYSPTIMSEPALFRGVLGKYIDDDGLTVTYTPSFTGYDSEGNLFDCELSAAELVHNPDAFRKCATCRCGTCLPKRLCICLYLDSVLNGVACQILTCNGNNKWEADSPLQLPSGPYGEMEDYTIYVRSQDPEEENGCVLVVFISGGQVHGYDPNLDPFDPGYLDPVPYYQAYISLEHLVKKKPIDDQLEDSYKCRSNGLMIRKTDGRALETNPSKWSDDTIILASIGVPDTRNNPVLNIGNLSIADAACNVTCRPKICRCCPAMPATAYLTVDTNCATGVIEMELTTDPLSGISSWSAAAGSIVVFHNCDTITGSESLLDVPVYGNIACSQVGDHGVLTVTIARDEALTDTLFVATYPCTGGDRGPDDPETAVFFNTTGTCCAYYGTPSLGTVTLSP